MIPLLRQNPPVEVVFDRVVSRAPGADRTTLEAASFTVEANGHVAIVGRLGSGKTTALELAAGLYPPDSGAVIVDGVRLALLDYADLQAHRLRTGFVFEVRGLLVNTSIFENIALPVRYHAGQSLAEEVKRAKVNQLLEELDIARFAAEIPARVHASVQKRALIARALLLEPGLLLIDEPQQNLVVEEQELVKRAIESRRAKRGMTVIQADHDGHFGPLRPERVVVLKDGQVAQVGGPELTMGAAAGTGSH